MSVLILGMKFPEKCGKCRFTSAFDCEVTKNFISTQNIRQPDCPLVEVKAHGDLIDRDELLASLHLYRNRIGAGLSANEVTVCMNKIREAPTVIPADDGDEKPFTHRDELHAMTDEELAHWLVERVTESPWCKPDAPIDPVTKQCQIWDCDKCALEWLRKEVDK